MKKYLSVKIITATPMTHGEFAKEKYGEGQIETEFSKENVNSEGYKVVYEDGYTSWSPKEVFEKAYREVGGLSFGLAIEAMKKGFRVARTGWNGKGMFIWLLPAALVKKEWVKDEMLLSVFGEKEELTCLGSIRMKTATGEVLTGWLASQTDILAEDWQIVGE